MDCASRIKEAVPRIEGCGLGSSAPALNDSAMTATKDWNSVRMSVLLIAE
jgi:hypothetical protein